MQFSFDKKMRYRPRRLRKSSSVRNLVQENRIDIADLVMPLFVREEYTLSKEIPSMPNIERLTIPQLIEECQELWRLGIQSVALFPVIEVKLKDIQGREAYNEEGLYLRAIRALKKSLPEMTIITDIALDPYCSHGHDGLLNSQGDVINDMTLKCLAKMAIHQARAGADIVAPSDMMDGRVAFIRSALDREGFTQVCILSYTAKYSSAFYGPFREALGSTLSVGDKKSYQMNPTNIREALWETKLDAQEGADILMVKPGMLYLDVLQAVCQKSPIPVAVYNVSGEYAMINSAAREGYIDYHECVLEVLHSFKRAGANFILSYHTKEVAKWLA